LLLFFKEGLTLLPRLATNQDSPLPASCIAGITDELHHCCPAGNLNLL
jgi:hypothetical protein